jgi:hypothetical protein
MSRKIKRRIPKKVRDIVKIPKIIKKGIKKIENTESFVIQNKENMIIRKYKRELSRTRNSASYRVGNAIISSIIKPWNLLFLPFSLITLS